MQIPIPSELIIKKVLMKEKKSITRHVHAYSTATIVVDPEDEVRLPDSLQDCSYASTRSDEKSVIEGSDSYIRRSFSDSASGSNRLNRIKIEREPIVNRHKTSNTVAIFRDRAVDSKDPDYDRRYERYMQRFDPRFGFNGGPCTMQPLYSPAVNYNTEFPQLEPGHRAQVLMDHPTLGHSSAPHGPWLSPSSPTAVNYGPSEGMMPAFNSNHVRGRSSTSVFVHSSQYSVPAGPGVSFAHPNGHIQTLAQTHPQPPDVSFRLAQPR